jgi:diguanylate cyclase (GGDEF)-like protein
LQKITETEEVAHQKHGSSGASATAYLVHIYPHGPGFGSRHGLGNTDLMIGRDEDCHICVKDKSVSRQHARIQRETEGFFVLDLGSTNGTHVNDIPAFKTLLQDGDYLRVGCSIFRFLAGDNVETEYYEEIHRLTIIDALTGSHNKRFLLEFLDQEIKRSNRYGRPLALTLFDIDRFKTLNDQFGHLAGDFVLRELGALVRGNIRKEELFARYGGEEFALVMPETSQDGAIRAAERHRQAVADHPFEFEGRPLQVTISSGVTATPGNESLTPTDFIRQADEKLYLAKEAGRNCVKA